MNIDFKKVAYLISICSIVAYDVVVAVMAFFGAFHTLTGNAAIVAVCLVVGNTWAIVHARELVRKS
ncbi:hypothetical protein HQ524_00530 [Candidatus Uhrbacteria bacterium]|nr:hypothetical protein [Candidatus Uhrbacteria bacterium]